jgi:hypothetical protein
MRDKYCQTYIQTHDIGLQTEIKKIKKKTKKAKKVEGAKTP